MDIAEYNQTEYWRNILAAFGADYRDHKEIVGASGLVHPMEAIGIDEKGARLILISSETNPRITALLRGDVQASLPDLKVIVARPVAIDLAHAARSIFFSESGTLDIAKMMEFGLLFQSEGKESEALKELIDEAFGSYMYSAMKSALPVKHHLFTIVEQLYDIDWSKFEKLGSDDMLQQATEFFTQFSTIDSLERDREQGICPIPTYEFTEKDWELFSNPNDLDEISQRLKEMDVLQYFYPPTDQLALGIIDKGIGTHADVAKAFDLSAKQGHELAGNEVIEETAELGELIEELRSKGYLVEGEFSLEVSEVGKSIRKNLQFRPREGLISKLSKLISVKVDLNLNDMTKSK